jgi:hypothetical protein
MKTKLAHLVAPLLIAAALAPTSAAALPLAVPGAPPAQVLRVAGDCRAIGQQIAAQEGGMLAEATPVSQGGQMACHIVVVVPPKDGERGRRIERIVPQ